MFCAQRPSMAIPCTYPSKLISFQARSCTIESLEMSHTCTSHTLFTLQLCHGHCRCTRKLCTSAAQDSAQTTCSTAPCGGVTLWFAQRDLQTLG